MGKSSKEFLHLVKNFLFTNINEKQKLVKNTFWILIAKIGGAIFRGLSFILSARFLGPNLYGIFSSVYSYVSIFQSLGDFGLTTILTKKVSAETQKKEIYFLNVLFIFLLLSIFLFIIAFKLMPLFLKSEVEQKIFILIFLALFFDLLREIGNSFLRGLEKMEIQSLIHNLVNFLAFIFVGLILKQKPLVETLSQIYFWSFLAGALFIMIFVKLNASNFKLKFLSLREIKSILTESWSLGLANVLFFLNFNLIIVILNLFSSNMIVGLYSSALKLYEALLFLPSSFSLAIFPLMAKNKDNLKKYLELSFHFFHFIFWPLIVGTIILGKEVLAFLFGQNYLSAYFYFVILMLGYLINSFLLSLINLLVVLQKRKELLIFDFLNFIFITILAFILIPWLKGYGAALVHFLNFVFLFIFAYLISKKYINFKLSFDWLKIFLSSLLMGIFILMIKTLNLHLIFIIILAFLFYLLLLFVFKEKIILDIKNLRNN